MKSGSNACDQTNEPPIEARRRVTGTHRVRHTTPVVILLLCLVCSVVAGAQGVSIARAGSQSSRTGPPEHFTGSVRVEPLFAATESSQASGAYVTFEPGARTAWHTHPRGQVLVVIAGVGRVQGWGSPVEEIRPGDVVTIPAGQKHWHGAAPDSRMTHLAVQEHLNGTVVQWMEQVSDADYGVPVRRQTDRRRALLKRLISGARAVRTTRPG